MEVEMDGQIYELRSLGTIGFQCFESDPSHMSEDDRIRAALLIDDNADDLPPKPEDARILKLAVQKLTQELENQGY